MAAVVVPNRSEQDRVVAPLKDDATHYRFEMVLTEHDGEQRVYADTAAELLDVLIAGYADMSKEERLAARVRFATEIVAPIQANWVAQAEPGQASEEELAVLMQPRFEPVVVDVWSSEVPLVLIDVHYAPYTDVPTPVSGIDSGEFPANLVMLSPGEDLGLLMSLARAGALLLSESPDHAL